MYRCTRDGKVSTDYSPVEYEAKKKARIVKQAKTLNINQSWVEDMHAVRNRVCVRA